MQTEFILKRYALFRISHCITNTALSKAKTFAKGWVKFPAATLNISALIRAFHPHRTFFKSNIAGITNAGIDSGLMARHFVSFCQCSSRGAKKADNDSCCCGKMRGLCEGLKFHGKGLLILLIECFMFCLNRKHNLKRHNFNYLNWPFLFKVNLKGSRPSCCPDYPISTVFSSIQSVSPKSGHRFWDKRHA